MKTATVTLADQDYVIRELPRKKNKAWRARVGREFEAIGQALEALPTMELSADSMGQLMTIVRDLVGRTVEAPDKIADLLYAYSPDLKGDRRRIDAEAYDSEIMSAFMEVLALAYPFGSIVRSISILSQTGPAVASTTPNSS